MSFNALIDKVKQAEGALEACERQGAADWRQFKSTWRSAWTPGRTVVAGLVSGFLVGRAQPLKHVDGASALRLFSAVSSLFAINRAEDAADQAERAADSAEDAEQAVAGQAVAEQDTAGQHAGADSDGPSSSPAMAAPHSSTDSQ